MSWYFGVFNVFLTQTGLIVQHTSTMTSMKQELGASLNLFRIFSNRHRIKSLDLGSNKHIYSLNLLLTGAKGSATSFSLTRPKSFTYNW